MAIQAYKSTYTLDKESVEHIDYLAEYWKTSKAEVIRRCVKKEVDRMVRKINPISVLEALESHPELWLDEVALQSWAKETEESRKDWDR